MPYAPRNATPELILSLMQPGCTYAPYKLADKIGAAAADVKPVLLKLVAAGKVETTRRYKGTQYALANTLHLKTRAGQAAPIDPSTIAGPRTFVVLTGQISGYDAEIARRRELCMLARGSR